mmetsp:Transcript_10807/g.49091  ORF Transcript_10807/g.49091 Transcript_10807/m.49091 type:complete len:272 (+) Transcript_10807:2598-3413(+)
MVGVKGVALDADVGIHRVEGPRQHRGDNLGAGDHGCSVVHRIGERAAHREGDIGATLLPLDGPALHQARGAERGDELHAAILNRPVHDDGPVLSVRQRDDTTQPKVAGGDLRRAALVARRGIRLGVESRGSGLCDLSRGVGVTQAHGADATLAEVRAETPSRTGYGPADITGDEERARDGGQRGRGRRGSARGSRRGRSDVVDHRRQALRRKVDDRESRVLNIAEEVTVNLDDGSIRPQLETTHLQPLDGVDVTLRLEGLNLVRSPGPPVA